MTYESDNLKRFEDETQTNINELKDQIKQLESQLNNLNMDLIKGVCLSLELLDPQGRYFDDEITDLKKLFTILIIWEFNKSDYIISKLENEYNK